MDERTQHIKISHTFLGINLDEFYKPNFDDVEWSCFFFSFLLFSPILFSSLKIQTCFLKELTEFNQFRPKFITKNEIK